MVTHAVWSLAQVFGLPEEQVRVTATFVGSGHAPWKQHSTL